MKLYATEALVNLTLSTKNQEAIGKARALPLVLSSLNSSHPQLQLQAMMLLYNLSHSGLQFPPRVFFSHFSSSSISHSLRSFPFSSLFSFLFLFFHLFLSFHCFFYSFVFLSFLFSFSLLGILFLMFSTFVVVVLFICSCSHCQGNHH